MSICLRSCIISSLLRQRDSSEAGEARFEKNWDVKNIMENNQKLLDETKIEG